MGVDAMNWFANHRQQWIEEMLDVYGFINRKHLTTKFGVTLMTAQQDINKFRRELKDGRKVIYNTLLKRYEWKR